MRRIAHDTAVPGNLFTEGNPSGPVPATTVTGDWLNIIQEEIAEVIEFAGLAVDQANAFGAVPENDVSQLRKAIQKYSGFDAWVGTGALATHATIKEANDDVTFPAGGRMRIISNLAVNETQVVSKDNVEIVFNPGVTVSRGAAATGIHLTGSGCILEGGRFSGFNLGGDKAIVVAGEYCRVIRPRFNDCIVEVEDLTTNGVSTENPITE